MRPTVPIDWGTSRGSAGCDRLAGKTDVPATLTAAMQEVVLSWAKVSR
jgi:hypothetical protein